MSHINSVYENSQEGSTVDGKTLKKFPLNFGASDENLSVMNPRLVDVEWKVIYTLSTKNLNKVFETRFLITLTLLT